MCYDLGQDEVPVRDTPTASVLKRSRLTERRKNSQPVCWQCGSTGHLKRDCPRRTAADVADKRDWRGCATGGRGNVRRQMAESTPTSPRVAPLLDGKQWLDGRVLAFEKEIEELRAPPMAELEAALEGKMEVQRRVTCRRVRVVPAAAQDGRDPAALWRGQLASDRVKASQNRLINSDGSSGGDQVGLYRPTRNRGKSPKHHPVQRRGLPGPAAS
jgi:hypothetical protein